MHKIMCLLTFAASLLAANAFGATNTTQVVNIAAASTNITTGAYVQLTASSPISARGLELCNSTTKVIKIAAGAAGSETDIAVAGNGTDCIYVPYYFAPGVRLSAEAVDANATTGFVVVSFIP